MTDCNELISIDDQKNGKIDAENFGEFVNSMSNTFQPRIGDPKRTIEGVINYAEGVVSSLGYVIIGDFADSPKAELTNPNQLYTSKNVANAEDAIWRYTGALPYTPTELAPTTNWVSVAQGELKSAAIAAGTTYDNITYSTNLVDEIKGHIFDATKQVTYAVAESAQGKFISSVVDGVLTTTDMSEYILTSINESSTLIDFGAAPNNPDIDSSNAINNAMQYSKLTGRIIDGEGKKYYSFGSVHVPENAKLKNAIIEFDNSVTDDFPFWVGDNYTDIPTTYTGIDIKIDDVKIIPSDNCLNPVRLRGIRSNIFTNFNIVARGEGALTGTNYVLIDGMINCKFVGCDWAPSIGYESEAAVKTQVFKIRQQYKLDGVTSAGNGLASTSSNFDGCWLHLAHYIGDIYGDSISFTNESIIEGAQYGIEVIETGSVIELLGVYWEAIHNYKVFARGIDTSQNATKVRIIGGKVQMGTNNGSQPNRAFTKTRHADNIEIEGMIIQGAAQTRLVEVEAGSNGKIESQISMSLNQAQKVRSNGNQVAATITTTNGSSTLVVTSLSHGRQVGDLINVVVAPTDPMGNVKIKLSNRIITVVRDSDNFELQSKSVSNNSGTQDVSYEIYDGGAFCFANLDQGGADIVTLGRNRIVGNNLYNFTDTYTELVEFSLELTANTNLTNMMHMGVSDYVAGDVAYIMSYKIIDPAGASGVKYANVTYGGNRYIADVVESLDIGTSLVDSVLYYRKPFRLEPREPVTVQYASSGSVPYPRTVRVILEVAHTGINFTTRNRNF